MFSENQNKWQRATLFSAALSFFLSENEDIIVKFAIFAQLTQNVCIYGIFRPF